MGTPKHIVKMFVVCVCCEDGNKFSQTNYDNFFSFPSSPSSSFSVCGKTFEQFFFFFFILWKESRIQKSGMPRALEIQMEMK